jgi:hypothetical protein
VSVVTALPTEPADPPEAAEALPRAERPWRWNVLVAVLALGLSFWVTHDLWSDPATHAIGNNSGDQAFFEWLLGYGSYVVSHGADPFFTDLLNVPLGVNLAANTSITVYAVLLSPITALLGTSVTFLLILTLNLACGAYAWYAFLVRWIVERRAAAAVAGIFCGFAPGYVSHANGHLNWSASWVAPVLLWWVLKTREPGRWLRNGLVLGVLVAVGFSIAAEGLFFTALASAVFLGGWARARVSRAEALAALPTVWRALAVTGVVAGALLAYPLWMHFSGPQAFKGTGFSQRIYAEDIFAYPSYASRSLAGGAGLGGNLAPNPTEETTFFGVPLLVLTVVSWRMLWRHAAPGRRATLRALAMTAGVFTVLSFGTRLKILGLMTQIPLPYAILNHLPLFNAALPARLGLIVAGVIGILLALTVDRLLADPPATTGRRTAWAAAFAVALTPLLPIPLLWAERAPIPQFIASGAWQRYVPDGGVLATLPPASDNTTDPQRWQAYTIADGGPHFRLSGGYFLGPNPVDGKGRIGAPARPTDRLLLLAARFGFDMPVDRFDREQARQDFAYWGVNAVVLPDRISAAQYAVHYDSLRRTAIALLGQPERVEDVWVWRITPGAALPGS